LLDWLAFFYLSFAQAGRESEKEGDMRMVVNNHQTTTVAFKAVAWCRRIMPNGQRQAGAA
jgi:hypothetical protein